MLLGQDTMRGLLEGALARAAPCDGEGLIEASRASVTRFASNRIHQNVAEENTGASFRAVSGKRIGGARTNGRDPERLGACASQAAEIAQLQSEDEAFPGLVASPRARDAAQFDREIANLTPEARAGAVREVVSRVEAAGLEASGALTVSADELVIGNTLGTFQYHPSTYAQLHVVARSGGAEGAGTSTSGAWSGIDPAAVAEEAIRKCASSKDPVAVGPGEWVVVLESEAVADMIDLLAYMGLGGLAFVEDRSFLCGKIGERICGETITLVDDPFDARGPVHPFDYEGVPKEKVVLIEKGVARTPVYDTRTAARAGTKTTGHALPEPNTFGPYPLNMALEPGDATLDEMIASTERGILVSRFHYTNPVDPRRTVITGMTRFGTFLIEGGQVTKAVRSMRFTDSVLDALSRVEALGRDAKRVDDVLAPPMKLSSWRFTGVTGE